MGILFYLRTFLHYFKMTSLVPMIWGIMYHYRRLDIDLTHAFALAPPIQIQPQNENSDLALIMEHREEQEKDRRWIDFVRRRFAIHREERGEKCNSLSWGALHAEGTYVSTGERSFFGHFLFPRKLPRV